MTVRVENLSFSYIAVFSLTEQQRFSHLHKEALQHPKDHHKSLVSTAERLKGQHLQTLNNTGGRGEFIESIDFHPSTVLQV